MLFGFTWVIIEAQFYNRNTELKEINFFWIGASSCLTDLGGGKGIEESFLKIMLERFYSILTQIKLNMHLIFHISIFKK